MIERLKCPDVSLSTPTPLCYLHIRYEIFEYEIYVILIFTYLNL